MIITIEDKKYSLPDQILYYYKTPREIRWTHSQTGEEHREIVYDKTYTGKISLGDIKLRFLKRAFPGFDIILVDGDKKIVYRGCEKIGEYTQC